MAQHDYNNWTTLVITIFVLLITKWWIAKEVMGRKVVKEI